VILEDLKVLSGRYYSQVTSFHHKAIAKHARSLQQNVIRFSLLPENPVSTIEYRTVINCGRQHSVV